MVKSFNQDKLLNHVIILELVLSTQSIPYLHLWLKARPSLFNIFYILLYLIGMSRQVQLNLHKLMLMKIT